MKHLQLVLTLLVFFVMSSGYSQHSNPINGDVVYNLPPGAKLLPKAKIYDLSFKLNKNATNVSYQQSDLKFLKEFDAGAIEQLKNEDPKYFAYLSEGENFIKSLSPKVRTIYTDTELWYIYAFDQKLKNTLTTIK
ncbi:hypothetical protein [Flavobacterium suncheonense]|nr:hypothetical protein [Flavobacterium suncheonense]